MCGRITFTVRSSSTQYLFKVDPIKSCLREFRSVVRILMYMMTWSLTQIGNPLIEFLLGEDFGSSFEALQTRPLLPGLLELLRPLPVRQRSTHMEDGIYLKNETFHFAPVSFLSRTETLCILHIPKRKSQWWDGYL